MDHHFESEHTQTTYEVNGKKYTSLEDVPEPFRSMFADRDADGIPDGFQDADADGIPDGLQDVDTEVTTSRTVVRTSRSSREISTSLDPRRPHRGTGAASDPTTLRCGVCNYDLSGSSVGGMCPECGSAVMQSIREVMPPRRPGFWSDPDGDIHSRPTSAAAIAMTAVIILAVVILILALIWIA